MRKPRCQAKPFEAYTELKGHETAGETTFQAEVADADLDWEAEVGRSGQCRRARQADSGHRGL